MVFCEEILISVSFPVAFSINNSVTVYLMSSPWYVDRINLNVFLVSQLGLIALLLNSLNITVSFFFSDFSPVKNYLPISYSLQP